jgi:pimeloyl-ACP methyl ester carboxylesterase
LTRGKDIGKRLFYRDSVHGKGNPAATVLFVHGNPESSYTYRHVIREIIESAGGTVRIIAMDHIGFGLSDRADYEMVSMDHAENLIQLIRHLDLRNFTMVVHDWGGPIGIGACLQEPWRVSNLVVLNSTVFPIPAKGLTYRNYPISWLGWCRTPWIIPSFLWGAFASYAIFRTPAGAVRLLTQMVAYIIKVTLGYFPKNEREARKLYYHQFRTRMNARSSRRLVRQSGKWGHGNRFKARGQERKDTAPFYRFIRENITRLWGPEGRDIGARMVLGAWDPLAKESVVSQWEHYLPQVRNHIRIYEGVGHFIEEVKPKEIAREILDVAGLL